MIVEFLNSSLRFLAKTIFASFFVWMIYVTEFYKNFYEDVEGNRVLFYIKGNAIRVRHAFAFICAHIACIVFEILF